VSYVLIKIRAILAVKTLRRQLSAKNPTRRKYFSHLLAKPHARQLQRFPLGSPRVCEIESRNGRAFGLLLSPFLHFDCLYFTENDTLVAETSYGKSAVVSSIVLPLFYFRGNKCLPPNSSNYLFFYDVTAFSCVVKVFRYRYFATFTTFSFAFVPTMTDQISFIKTLAINKS